MFIVEMIITTFGVADSVQEKKRHFKLFLQLPKIDTF